MYFYTSRLLLRMSIHLRSGNLRNQNRHLLSRDLLLSFPIFLNLWRIHLRFSDMHRPANDSRLNISGMPRFPRKTSSTVANVVSGN